MKYIVILFISIFVSCSPIANSVDGMIVKRPDGTDMKIEWNNGYGNSYYFYTKVLVTTQTGDTMTEWRLLTD